MALDDALEFLGVKGLFPLGIYLMTLYIGLCTPWILLVDSFAGYVPKHHCYVGENIAKDNYSRYYPPDPKNPSEFDQCLVYENHDIYANLTKNATTCANYTYDYEEGDTEDISYVPLWNLVCSREFWSKFATTMFFLGNVVGCLIFTTISDKFGRLKVFLVTLWFQGAFGVALAFSDYMGGLPMYLILRTVLGALSAGNYNVGFVYMSEMFAPRYRAVVGFVVNVVWSVATAVLPGLALLIPSWRYLIIVISVLNFATIPCIFFFPESLPWLLRNGKKEKVREYLEGVAESRRMNLPENILACNGDDDDDDENSKNAEDEELGFLDLIKHRIIVRCMLIGMGLFFLNSLVYYGMTMSSSTLSKDRHMNFFLSGLAEVPGYLIGMFSTNAFGRRRPMMILFTIAGVALVIVASLNAALPAPVNVYGVMTLIFIGKFGISGTYGIVFLFVTEIFPTNSRSIALGMCNIGARMGSIWSPYASILQERSPATLQFIFGFGALLGVFGTYFLPETHKRPLPNTVSDLKELDAQTKRWRKVKVNVITDKTMLVDPKMDVEMEDGIVNSGFSADNPVIAVTAAPQEEPIYAPPQRSFQA